MKGGLMPEDTLEQNKAIMHRMLEAFNTGNTAVVAEVLDPNVRNLDRRKLGKEAQLQRAHPIQIVQTEILRNEDAFPDRYFREEHLLAEGDTVVLTWSMTGTNTGPILGRRPTGKQVELFGTEVARIQDGKIIEHRGDEGAQVFDALFQLDLLDTEIVQKIKR